MKLPVESEDFTEQAEKQKDAFVHIVICMWNELVLLCGFIIKEELFQWVHLTLLWEQMSLSDFCLPLL